MPIVTRLACGMIGEGAYGLWPQLAEEKPSCWGSIGCWGVVSGVLLARQEVEDLQTKYLQAEDALVERIAELLMDKVGQPLMNQAGGASSAIYIKNDQ
jgi:hypothetical protein